jgi:aminopeptidase N
VRLDAGYADAELLRLFQADSDGFARWEAGQTLATGLILKSVAASGRGETVAADPAFIQAFGRVLTDETADQSLLTLMLTLPSETYLGEQTARIDVDAIHRAREGFRRALAHAHRGLLLKVYRASQANDPRSRDPVAAGRRALRNLALSYLVSLGDEEALGLCARQASEAQTMTEVQGALAALCETDSPQRQGVLDAFYAKWQDEPLVMDKWFAVQAMAPRADALETVERLTRHPGFSIRNPNKVRALIGAFAQGNPVGFHRADGAGHRFLADKVLELNALNPQVAARMLAAMTRWRRYDEARAESMRRALERVAAAPGLSKDVFEIAGKSLAE